VHENLGSVAEALEVSSRRSGRANQVLQYSHTASNLAFKMFLRYCTSRRYIVYDFSMNLSPSRYGSYSVTEHFYPTMQSSAIRAVTHRLTTTPVNELPQLVPFLAASLSECGNILIASPKGTASKSLVTEPGDVAQFHKLRTRLTSLLQDRSVEGRWTAVVLIKAILEAGHCEVLSESEAWVRGLLVMLTV
jgi:hypothetical protein